MDKNVSNLKEIPFKLKIHRLAKIKGQKMIFHVNTNHKTARVQY